MQSQLNRPTGSQSDVVDSEDAGRLQSASIDEGNSGRSRQAVAILCNRQRRRCDHQPCQCKQAQEHGKTVAVRPQVGMVIKRMPTSKA